jgi:hypothetical protein
MPHNHNQMSNSIIILITYKQVSSKNKFAQCKQERDVTIVHETQDVHNTRLCLIIMRKLQYEHCPLGLQLGRVERLTSPHQETHT